MMHAFLVSARNGGILLLALFVCGCASSTKTNKRNGKEVEPAPLKRPVASKPAVEYDEAFDPRSLKEITFTVPHKSQVPMVQSQTGLPITTDTTARDTTWVTAPGYQLQLLQTENGAQARETLRFAILDLNTDTEIVYDAPYYKVRAGRFLNRAEAERLQTLADEKGYTNSWVVRTSIRIRAYELAEFGTTGK
ncbi:MAG: SPOR domain-containing protein [bacterium]